MAFHSTEYDVYVILGDTNAVPLWHWTAWRRFLPMFDPLLAFARGKPAIRTLQYGANPRDGALKFGRIGWNDAGHHKWTHGSPATSTDSRSWKFVNVEIWAPGWTQCVREDSAPDVYMSMASGNLGGGLTGEVVSSPNIVLAVAAQLAGREGSAVTDVVRFLRDVTAARLVGYKRRRWGSAFGANAFTSSIQDLAISRLIKIGSASSGPVGFHVLQDKWDNPSPNRLAPFVRE